MRFIPNTVNFYILLPYFGNFGKGKRGGGGGSPSMYFSELQTEQSGEYPDRRGECVVQLQVVRNLLPVDHIAAIAVRR